MTMICRNCGARNPEDSKFCNNCGSALQPVTSLICPNCGASNPSDLLYCDSCGTRLQQPPDMPDEAETRDEPADRSETPPTPFTLPSRPPGMTANLSMSDGIPDWLKTGEKPEDAETGDLEKHRPGDDLPTWLLDDGMEAGLFEDTRSTDELFASAQSAEPDEEDPVEQDLPNWLRGLAPEGTGPLPVSGSGGSGDQDQSSLDDWLADFEEAAQMSETPSWLAEGEPDSEPQASVEQPDAEEWPAEFQDDEGEVAADWLADLEVDHPAAGEHGDESQAVEPEDEAGRVLGWLAGLDAAQEEETDQPDESRPAPRGEAEGDFGEEGVPDWLAEEPTRPASEPVPAQDAGEIIPDWLSDLDEGPPAETVEEPAAPVAEEIPDWLADLEADEAAVQPEVEDEPVAGIPGWLGDLTEEPATAAAEAERDRARLDKGEPEAETGSEPEILDWLSELPSPELDQVTPAEELSSWLEEEEEAPPTITGEEREGPVWPAREEELPESVFTEPEARAGAEDEERYDWLPQGEETPDWLLAIEPDEEAEPAPEAEEEVPDWLSELDAAIGELEAASGESATDWPQDLQSGEPVSREEDVDEAWAAADRQAASDAEPEPAEADETGDIEQLPAWLAPTELSVQAEHLAFEPETPGGDEESRQEEPALEVEPIDDEAIPDWLQELEQIGDAGLLSPGDEEV
ncbi:MAG: zinc ribbon domain-containing protein, partial [Anaerolineae bacterium]|nr:zinc ribbon domain-containing protein [Anaerolineae bacterium]